MKFLLSISITAKQLIGDSCYKGQFAEVISKGLLTENQYDKINQHMSLHINNSLKSMRKLEALFITDKKNLKTEKESP